jgi:hypothetical protein
MFAEAGATTRNFFGVLICNDSIDATKPSTAADIKIR